MRALALLSAMALLATVGCVDRTPPRDLGELVIQDSTYLAPETMQAFSGPVFRTFPGDSTRNEIEGALLDGTWHGDFVVYHPSGRLRYAGVFHLGDRCGAWTENTLDLDPVNIYDAVMSEVEAMALYPPCPPDR